MISVQRLAQGGGCRRVTRATTSLLLVLVASTTAAAQSRIGLEIDRVHVIDAERVTPTPTGDNLDIVLTHAPGRTIRLPIERVACTDPNAAGCPQKVAEVAQAVAAGRLPKGVAGFEIHGSNTVGAELMPKLLEGMLSARLADPVTSTQETSEGKRHTVEFETEGGVRQKVDIHAFGSSTGFKGLLAGTAQLWMSSRPAKDGEVKEIRGSRQVELLAPESEHVIALDGLAVIVNKSNPLGALSIKEIADVFSGRIKDWQDIKDSNRRGPIKVYRRDDNSGTASTFKDLVLEPNKVGWTPAAVPHSDSVALEQAVTREADAIGFVGMGYVQNAKALAIKADCGMAFRPDAFNVKTEEYPLSRRLFVYSLGKPSNPLATDLLEFAASNDGQTLIREQRFVDLLMDSNGLDFDNQGARLANMLVAGAQDQAATTAFIDAVRFARRVSTTLRFRSDSNELDNKAVRDLTQLADALKTGRIEGSKEFLLIGFADDQEAAQGKAKDVAEGRAIAVAKLLQQKLDQHPNKALEIKVHNQNVKAFGAAAPAVCNDARGRTLNRRVEVWVR